MTGASVGQQIFGKPDCQHGAPWDAECLECRIVWYRECREDARKRVLSCTDEIEKLLAIVHMRKGWDERSEDKPHG